MFGPLQAVCYAVKSFANSFSNTIAEKFALAGYNGMMVEKLYVFAGLTFSKPSIHKKILVKSNQENAGNKVIIIDKRF